MAEIKPGGLTPAEWHTRFQSQAGWTRSIRQVLFEKAGLQQAMRILEPGVGTGAVAHGLLGQTHAQVYGIDLDLQRLELSRQIQPTVRLAGADALVLPFPPAAFDLVYCHFLLLWVAQPLAAIQEMVRVTRPGGWVLALAEPDYDGRIDHPAPLARLGRLQTESLAAQGADREIGRRLGSLFLEAGLAEVETGLLGGHWRLPADPSGADEEWRILEEDLRGRVADEEIASDKQLYQSAVQRGDPITFVPTFFAAGKVA